MNPATPPPAVSNQLVLTGSPFEITLPDVCAKCGAAAKARLQWERVFEVAGDEGGSSQEVHGAIAPFCSSCLAEHERDVRRMPWLTGLLQCFRSEMIIPAVFSSAGAVFVAYVVLPKMMGGGNWKSQAFIGGLVLFFGWIAWASLNAAWDATRHRRVPALTATTRAFGFSRDISNTFEGERHLYTLANQAFFEALKDANQGRMWKPSGKQAQRAAGKRTVLYVLLAGGAVVAVLWDWISPLLQRPR